MISGNIMLVKDLYLGEIEGSNEFKDKESVENLYFLGIDDNDLNDLISGKKRYIHGYKGTGKTSLIKRLQFKCRDENIQYIDYSFRRIREDAEVIESFRNKFKDFKYIYGNEDNKDITTLTFWKWYLLSAVAKEFIKKANFLNLIYSTTNKFFRGLASVIDELTLSIPGILDFRFKLRHEDSTEKEETISEAARKIRELSREVEQSLNEKVIIFIDELELTKARETYEIDRTLIKNLLLATKHINSLSKNLHIVLAVRDEVINDLMGEEINKLISDFGVKLSWWRRSAVTLEHDLWRLMLKKIRYSMERKEFKDTSNMDNTQIWKYWFPFSIDGKDSWKFFFEITWARPRDIVRLLKLMQKECRDRTTFSIDCYNKIVKDYSREALSEITEEISTIFNEDTTRAIKEIIQELGINFTCEDFLKRAQNKINDPSLVLREMYRVGFVGNHYRLRNKSIWRFFYRNDTVLDTHNLIEVHRALQEALGIKGRFNMNIFNA